ncbi:PREDICTED: putative F-box/LRR-repeat protein 23 [Camelina sativa]|uniref:F-box/LRR-repeat protein 23 n=1 Tax=Camelina sativa TaxID=90675 RepID=A0ABM0V6P4_CAMSA|nr:PREDICTED: putative F-box/LRR-repeat protein 23 [Camelina sativa]
MASFLKVNEKPINWAELQPDLLSSILLRLDVVEILENAQKVCKPWRRVTKDPSMWRKIDMQNVGSRGFCVRDLEKMCSKAVDRSKGDLVEIKIGAFGTVELLNYIADRASNLRSFGLAMYYGMSKEGLVNAVGKLPRLEELEVSIMWSRLDLKAIGHSCSRLKSLKLNCLCYWGSYWRSNSDDVDALAIAESMTELRHLQLLWNGLSDIGLYANLDNCLNLEHLDLRRCFNIRDLENRYSEKIKVLRRHPNLGKLNPQFRIQMDSLRKQPEN